MKWIKERDALIAQTMAFVQSVTGKKDEPGEPRLPLAPLPFTPSAHPPSPSGRVVQAGIESASLGTEANHFPPPQSFQWAEAPARPLNTPRPALASDFRSEMKERIANFRKHQERFNREREEYFSTTLAKARAAIKQGSPPRAEK